MQDVKTIAADEPNFRFLLNEDTMATEKTPKASDFSRPIPASSGNTRASGYK